jgi:hypothetical protein
LYCRRNRRNLPRISGHRTFPHFVDQDLLRDRGKRLGNFVLNEIRQRV